MKSQSHQPALRCRIGYCSRPRRHHRQPTRHGRSCGCSLSLLLLSVAAAALSAVARSLSVEAVKAVVHAFISSRLDYCNSLLTGVNDGLLRRLQSVQNAAARLVTGTRRCEHITPVLRQLHWLPVRQRIQYKLASLAFRALSGLPPDYLAGDCQLIADSGRRSLRSAERRVCYVPRQNSTFGDRSFAAAGSRTWNELPFSLRDTTFAGYFQ